MSLSYNKLWKLLIDKGTNKTKLREATHMSSSTMAKLTNQEMVALSILEKICAQLDCNIGDVMQFINLDEVKRKMNSINQEGGLNG